MYTPVFNVLSIWDPLLLSSDEWLRGWGSWSTEVTGLTNDAEWSWSLSLKKG